MFSIFFLYLFYFSQRRWELLNPIKESENASVKDLVKMFIAFPAFVSTA